MLRGVARRRERSEYPRGGTERIDRVNIAAILGNPKELHGAHVEPGQETSQAAQPRKPGGRKRSDVLVWNMLRWQSSVKPRLVFTCPVLENAGGAHAVMGEPR